MEKLKSIGMKLCYWHGNCEAGTVSAGKYNVSKGEEGIYALTFDNTFAKSFSKTVTFALLIHSTNNPPLSGAQVNIKPIRSRPKLDLDRRSSDSFGTAPLSSTLSKSARTASRSAITVVVPANQSTYSLADSNIFSGILQKRRRKRAQGYARRYFTLDFGSGTLSYYHDRNASTIRGSVPLYLAAIGTNPARREISIDSGAEIWHLRTLNKKDYETWRNALDVASQTSSSAFDTPHLGKLSRAQSLLINHAEDTQDWAKVESLLSKISTSRDLARTLARDSDPRYLPSASASTGELSQYAASVDMSPLEPSMPYHDTSAVQERRPFWKRKTSAQNPLRTKRSVSNTRASPVVPSMNSKVDMTEYFAGHSSARLPDESLHNRCLQLMQDLDKVVGELASLIAGNKQRRVPVAESLAINPRLSLDSSRDQEFYDAEAGESQLFTIDHETDEEGSTEVEDNPMARDEDSSASDLDETVSLAPSVMVNGTNPAFPTKSKSLDFSKFSPAPRRTRVKLPTVPPPSLIGFLRKNVGKDLSTISMPCTANEPLSLLQRISEQMEYTALLDQAATAKSENERLVYISAFALSLLSGSRIKERSIRKPFNPMLGETFELVREDQGYRFIAEKVCHRPVKLAYQADALKWSVSQSPAPIQKFWGKSIELVTEGKVRVSLHDQDEQYSWTPASCVLRNLIAGEKYVEPSGTMMIRNETTGSHAVATFKVKGIFSGRSDEVSVVLFDAHGSQVQLGLTGKWTESLLLTSDGISTNKQIWKTGSLVPDALKCYGFTTFAASLNEMNLRDKDAIAPTDSRRRPDQRAAEDCDYDTAEDLKARLEEAQRQRRKDMEEQGQEWEPAWFTRITSADGEEVWKLKSGKDSYWDARDRQAWRKDKACIFQV